MLPIKYDHRVLWLWLLYIKWPDSNFIVRTIVITLHHLWCVKTTRLQTEYVFGEQEKLQQGKSGKQGRQRAKNVLELVCAPPPKKKTPAAWMLHTDGSALNNSDEPQHENWISSTKKRCFSAVSVCGSKRANWKQHSCWKGPQRHITEWEIG